MVFVVFALLQISINHIFIHWNNWFFSTANQFDWHFMDKVKLPLIFSFKYIKYGESQNLMNHFDCFLLNRKGKYRYFYHVYITIYLSLSAISLLELLVIDYHFLLKGWKMCKEQYKNAWNINIGLFFVMRKSWSLMWPI